MAVITNVSEYAPLEAQAFDGETCDQGYVPSGCVLWAIRQEDWDGLDRLLDRTDIVNVDGSSNTWEVACAVCGLRKPLDILETSDTKFDLDAGAYTQSSSSTLSKSGARRRIDEAKEEMDRIALDFQMPNQALLEAHWLFKRFHNAGSSKGGRGHKTTVIAALHIASRNADLPIPIEELCKAHSESPVPKVVKRFIKQAREMDLIKLIPPSAANIVSNVLARMGSENEEINEMAKELCAIPLSNVPAKNQAASAIYLAAQRADIPSRTRTRNYSGVRIAQFAFVERRQIYKYAKRMQGEPPIRNPPSTPTMPADDVQLLRRIRKG